VRPARARRRRRAAVGHLLLAGSDLPVEEEQLHAAVDGPLGERLRRGNDTFAVLRAGTSAAGASRWCAAPGINCVGVGPTAPRALPRARRDQRRLGRRLRRRARRAGGGGPQRGRPRPAHALERAVPAHFGSPRRRARRGDPPRRVALRRIVELPPLVFDAAAADPVAAAIVDRLAAEVLALVRASIERLELDGAPSRCCSAAGCSAPATAPAGRDRGRRRTGGAATWPPRRRSWCALLGLTSLAPGRRRSRGRGG
jgi:hypothetical protein